MIAFFRAAKPTTIVAALLLISCTGGGGSSDGGPRPDSANEPDSAGDGADTAGCDGDVASDPHNCGACGHDCLGAACIDGLCQPTVLETVVLDGADDMRLTGLAIGPDDVFVYNTHYSLLGRISKQGGPIDLLVPSTLPTDVAVYGGYVYWSVDDWSGTPVGRRPIGGGEPEYGWGGTWGTALAVDDDGVFVSDDRRVAGFAEDGAITRHTHALSRDLAEQSTLFGHWARLLVATDTQLVWTEEDDSEHVFAGSKQWNPDRATRVTQLPVPGQGRFVGLAADLTDAYVTDGSTLWRVPLSGSAPTTLLSDAGVSSVSVDDSGIYVTTADEVLRVNPSSSAVEVIAKGQDDPFDVATDPLFVYWINARNEVIKVAK